MKMDAGRLAEQASLTERSLAQELARSNSITRLGPVRCPLSVPHLTASQPQTLNITAAEAR